MLVKTVIPSSCGNDKNFTWDKKLCHTLFVFRIQISLWASSVSFHGGSKFWSKVLHYGGAEKRSFEVVSTEQSASYAQCFNLKKMKASGPLRLSQHGRKCGLSAQIVSIRSENDTKNICTENGEIRTHAPKD